MTPEPDNPMALIVAEEGAGFRPGAVRRFPRNATWEWRPLARALVQASLIREQQGTLAASAYLDGLFPKDFDVGRLDPLAKEALAEIANLWGVCFRYELRYEQAIAMYDLALMLSRRRQIRQFAFYNRGFARMLHVLGAQAETPRSSEKGLRSAAEDMAEATFLDAADTAAWAQRGTIALLRASFLHLRVGTRLGLYQDAVLAYDRALPLEKLDHERNAMLVNRARAQEGANRMSRCGWLERTFGKLDWTTGDP
jgi:tetratricopeptide (TPR) repeat protein